MNIDLNKYIEKAIRNASIIPSKTDNTKEGESTNQASTNSTPEQLVPASKYLLRLDEIA